MTQKQNKNQLVETLMAILPQNKWVRGLVAVLVIAVTSFFALDNAPTTDTTVTPPPAVVATQAPSVTTNGVEMIELQQGWGARKGWWEVYFVTPTDERNRALWTGGVDDVIADFIRTAERTLDIAAFELNSEVITEAIIDAHERGVTVRMVTDRDHGLNDDDSTFAEIQAVGIPVVDDARSGLMHNKFIVIDGLRVLTGATNFTMNGLYRNDNNFIIVRSRPAAESYTEEFEEMFVRREFGITSSVGNERAFVQDGTPVEILYGAENDVIGAIISRIEAAEERIYFMAFSFTLEEIGEALLDRIPDGIDIQGVFELVGSGTRFSRFTTLYCAGLDVRRDGNPSMMHHKVFIIDDTVLTGSFNFSRNASRSNDENVIFITDADLADLYLKEFERVQGLAVRPETWDCPA